MTQLSRSSMKCSIDNFVFARVWEKKSFNERHTKVVMTSDSPFQTDAITFFFLSFRYRRKSIEQVFFKVVIIFEGCVNFA